MLKTTTYAQGQHATQDFLASFSALDHSVLSGLSPAEASEQFKQMLLRLAILSAVHGMNTPRDLIVSLQECRDNELVSTATAYLELGHLPQSAPDEDSVAKRELQQELVHFSRIVDIPNETQVRKRTRLWRTAYLPTEVKVMCELMTVIRARLRQRGTLRQSRVLHGSNAVLADVGSSITIVSRSNESSYLFLVVASNRRIRRIAARMFRSLLDYLGPIEAGYVLSWYWRTRSQDMRFSALDIRSADSVDMLVHTSAVTDAGSSYESSLRALPLAGNHTLSAIPNILRCNISAEFRLETTTTNGENVIHIAPTGYAISQWHTVRLFSSLDRSGYSLEISKENSVSAVKQLMCNLAYPVLSLECGHIHLDRALDQDQDIGMDLGSLLFQNLSTEQDSPPLLMPMIDDDHVLVNLKPSVYVDYFRQTFKYVPFQVIPESSPIVRAIVVALFRRLMESLPVASQVRKRGDNVYFAWNDGEVCELFEDFNGRCDNGCVFFECALLVFRSNPDLFTDHFQERYGLQRHIHDLIMEIWDTEEHHDIKQERLREIYRTFSAVTNPHRRDAQFCEIVNKVITSARTPLVHVNVLEDYYETQQRKVRRLLKVLSIPIELITVHFNPNSGRVAVVR